MSCGETGQQGRARDLEAKEGGGESEQRVVELDVVGRWPGGTCRKRQRCDRRRSRCRLMGGTENQSAVGGR